jgi:hypothetical protein
LIVENHSNRKENAVTPRMTNPALLLPEALEAALALSASTAKGDLPPRA